MCTLLSVICLLCQSLFFFPVCSVFFIKFLKWSTADFVINIHDEIRFFVSITQAQFASSWHFPSFKITFSTSGWYISFQCTSILSDFLQKSPHRLCIFFCSLKTISFVRGLRSRWVRNLPRKWTTKAIKSPSMSKSFLLDYEHTNFFLRGLQSR